MITNTTVSKATRIVAVAMTMLLGSAGALAKDVKVTLFERDSST